MIYMSLERRGDYVVGTQSEIDAYRSQQADSQAGSAIAGTVAVAGIAVVLGIAALFISAGVSIKNAAIASAAQISTWHDMYSKLWGEEKADDVLEKARKKLRFRTLKYCILGMLFPFIYILGLPLLLGVLFGLPVFLAARYHDLIPYSLTEIWYSFWHGGGRYEFISGMGAGELPVGFLIGIYLFMIAIIVPVYVRMAKKGYDIALLTRYNNLIYNSYPKAVCSHCGKKTRVLSLGQCRNCFKFMRSLSYEDAKALSGYKMTVNYDFSKTASNEFFSAEIGRTVPWSISTWVIVLLMFILPLSLFMGGIYTGAWFVIPLVADTYSPSAGFFLIAIGTIIGCVILSLGSSRILGAISNGMSSRDIRKFANTVKTELLRHNLPTDNWDI